VVARTEDRLAAYQAKRDFTKSPEPAGKLEATQAGTRPLRFVVQRHRARRLHYDLRLEMGGVLASWAVPKGPTLDPGARRMAVHVEDHPLQYFDFEGVIPKGEYGGGDVIVWDEGTWVPVAAGDPPDPLKAVQDGELHFDLFGHKLAGRFLLVRTGPSRRPRIGDRQAGRSSSAGAPGRSDVTERGPGRDGEDAGGRDGVKEQWLLLKKRDSHAVEGWAPEDYPRSVLSGRTNDEVKADPERMWRSSLPPSEAGVDLRAGKAPASLRPGVGHSMSPTGDRGTGAEQRLREQERSLSAGSTSGTGVLPSSGGTGASLLAGLRVSEDELAELEALGPSGVWHVFGRVLPVSGLDRELLPPAKHGEGPVTKRELLRYAALVAPLATPYLVGRTSGVRLGSRAPAWLARTGEAGSARVMLEEPAALVWATSAGALEWTVAASPLLAGCRRELPTYLVIAVEAEGEASWQGAALLASLYGTALDHLGVKGYPKLTGLGGIEVWAPLRPELAFEEAKAWAMALSRAVRAVAADVVGCKTRCCKRSVLAPYSPRNAAGAPVSAPAEWSEVGAPSFEPAKVTVRTMASRLAEKGDLFRGVLDGAGRLPKLG